MNNLIMEFHHTEKKSIALVIEYFENHKTIAKHFNYCGFSKDDECPDTLVKHYPSWDLGMKDPQPICAFEHKFGSDCVASLNANKLTNQLKAMKQQQPSIPLYLFIIQEYVKQDRVYKCKGKGVYDQFGEPFEQILIEEEVPVISAIDMARCVGICQELNIHFKYCSNERLFAKKLIDTIMKPSKVVDLGQRFVEKSTGSRWNRQLQLFSFMPPHRADLIEAQWDNMKDFIYDFYATGRYNHYKSILKDIFTMNGVTHKKRLDNFLKEISE